VSMGTLASQWLGGVAEGHRVVLLCRYGLEEVLLVVLPSKVWNFPALHSSRSSASLMFDGRCVRLWVSWYLALMRSADSCLLSTIPRADRRLPGLAVLS
jgi:hypothetical protein